MSFMNWGGSRDYSGPEEVEEDEEEVFGSIRKYSEVFGSIWKYSEVFGSIWKYSEVFGSIRKYSEVYCIYYIVYTI